MAKLLLQVLAVAICCWPLPHLAANWQDLYRQYPEAQLQSIQTATLPFSVLMREASAPRKGTVVLMPAANLPVAPELFFNLHHQLPDQGWTLIMLPAPDYHQQSGSFADFQQQLLSRWQPLQSLIAQGPIILIAEGNTAGLLQGLLSERAIANISALVSIGAYWPEPAYNNLIQQQLINHNLPVLDIVSPSFHPATQATALQRQVQARMTNPLYRQYPLLGVDQHPALLTTQVKTLLGWLQTSGF
ncbi:hypothetical protein AJE_11639 [Alishewanella jeotgali KCTC 22429]|uniref:DUF3530 domain-containing protein n=2 Tax=Alishewanella jeotgali TaxID=545533 RepID=H3ZG31_9ALTE|nr:hypothetical protein AJE_11639 [Alishewanella jeotgali KCTC 22429]